jgi:hypothetical protein
MKMSENHALDNGYHILLLLIEMYEQQTASLKSQEKPSPGVYVEIHTKKRSWENMI